MGAMCCIEAPSAKLLDPSLLLLSILLAAAAAAVITFGFTGWALLASPTLQQRRSRVVSSVVRCRCASLLCPSLRDQPLLLLLLLLLLCSLHSQDGPCWLPQHFSGAAAQCFVCSNTHVLDRLLLLLLLSFVCAGWVLLASPTPQQRRSRGSSMLGAWGQAQQAWRSRCVASFFSNRWTQSAVTACAVLCIHSL
jgi:hypothetical protein